MPVYKLIDVASLEAPDHPQREETLMEGMDILVQDIKDNGLLQPIGVTVLPDGVHKIRYGHRRSLAVTILKWDQVPAMVYQPDEGDADAQMGAENFHRNKTSLREEALFYQRVFASFPTGTIGMAARYNVPQKRIEELLLIAEKSPELMALMGQGKCSIAQACEVLKFTSDGYRLQATEMVEKLNMPADQLRKWRQEIQAYGADANAQIQDSSNVVAIPERFDPGSVPCYMNQHATTYQLSQVYRLCNDHWNMIIKDIEYGVEVDSITRAGLLPEYKQLVRRAVELLGE